MDIKKMLFWMSEIVIFDIRNNYSWYQKLCRKGVYFGYQKHVQISKNKHLLPISKTVILDMQSSYFWCL